jgi:hypothetical protein
MIGAAIACAGIHEILGAMASGFMLGVVACLVLSIIQDAARRRGPK